MLQSIYEAVTTATGAQKPVEAVRVKVPSRFEGVFPVQRSFLENLALGLAQEKPVSLMEFVGRLEMLREDENFNGIVILDMPDVDAHSLVNLQTLRLSISQVVQAGKRVVSFAPNYSTKAYYLASACSEIYILPAGTLYTVGLASLVVYFQKALENLGVKFEAIAISDYKNLYDNLTNFEPSEASKEQSEWLLDSFYNILVSGIAVGRNTSEEAVKEMIKGAPYSSYSAKEKGFVDEVCHEEDWAQLFDVKEILEWETAYKRLKALKPEGLDSKQFVGVIYASGMIMHGPSMGGFGELPLPFFSQGMIGDSTIKSKVRQLYADPNCLGLILYIDSPGGLATASESIAATLKQFAEKKPLIAYMGGVAASGGYYIATAANHIIANSASITGSIGVIMGKPVFDNLFTKLDLNKVINKRGDNASLLLPVEGFSESQRELFTSLVKDQYKLFVDRVVESRQRKGFSEKEIDEIVANRLEGRVWTGEQAHQYGLVDELGDFQKAIDKMKELTEQENLKVLVVSDVKPIGIQIAEQNPVTLLKYMHKSVRSLTNGPQMLMPFTFNFA